MDKSEQESLNEIMNSVNPDDKSQHPAQTEVEIKEDDAVSIYYFRYLITN